MNMRTDFFGWLLILGATLWAVAGWMAGTVHPFVTAALFLVVGAVLVAVGRRR